MVFRNPSNKHYSVAMTREAFADIIWAWIGTVSDCSIFHLSSSRQPFKAVYQSETLHRVLDSNQERDPGTFQRGDDSNSKDVDQTLCSTSNENDHVDSPSTRDSTKEASLFPSYV